MLTYGRVFTQPRPEEELHAEAILTRASYTATAIFICLAACYAGTLLLTFAAVGSENARSALAAPDFLFSVVSRLVGAVVCIGIVAMLRATSRFRSLAEPFAWGLAVAVAVVVLRDVIVFQDSSALLGLVALGLIAIHVFAAVCVRNAIVVGSAH